MPAIVPCTASDTPTMIARRRSPPKRPPKRKEAMHLSTHGPRCRSTRPFDSGLRPSLTVSGGSLRDELQRDLEVGVGRIAVLVLRLGEPPRVDATLDAGIERVVEAVDRG